MFVLRKCDDALENHVSPYRIVAAPEHGVEAHVLVVVDKNGAERSTIIFESERAANEILERIKAEAFLKRVLFVDGSLTPLISN